MMYVDELCKLKIDPLHREAMEQAQERLDGIAKPLDGLGQFERLLVQMAGIQEQFLSCAQIMES